MIIFDTDGLGLSGQIFAFQDGSHVGEQNLSLWDVVSGTPLAGDIIEFCLHNVQSHIGIERKTIICHLFA